MAEKQMVNCFTEIPLKFHQVAFEPKDKPLVLTRLNRMREINNLRDNHLLGEDGALFNLVAARTHCPPGVMFPIDFFAMREISNAKRLKNIIL